MTDTIIERNEEVENYSFQVIQSEQESFKISIIFVDPQFTIVWMERPLINYLGEPLSHFSGKSIFELIPAEEIVSLVLKPENIEKTYNISELHFCVSPFNKKTLNDCNVRIKLYQNDRGMITGYFIVISQIETKERYRYKQSLKPMDPDLGTIRSN